MQMRRGGAAALLVAAAWLGGLGCASGPRPDRCKIEVVGLEELRTEGGVFDVAYRVRGEAGSPARVWLAARRGQGDYVSGGALEVGPGPFQAVVELELTGRPAEYVAVLQVGGRRCVDEIPTPR